MQVTELELNSNSRPDVRLQVCHTSDGFAALRGEWDALLAASITNEVFLSWEWQSTWWDCYTPGDLWLIAGRNSANELIGIAPWFLEQPSGVVRTIGCVEVTDYLDILVRPETSDCFCEALAEWLAGHTEQFRQISFCNLPQHSAVLTHLAQALSECGFAVETEQQEVCPAIQLPATFDSYLETLDKKNRHELRRKLRRAEDGDDHVAWYIVGTEANRQADTQANTHADLQAETERFLTLMAASHPDKAAFLQNQQHVAFFRAITPKLAERGWLQLAFLTVEGEPAAAYFSVDYNNHIGLYNSGLKPDAYSHLSPGIVLLAYIIRYAIEQKRTVFDFLRGNEDYKYRMGAQDTPVLELRAAPGRSNQLQNSPESAVSTGQVQE